MTMSQTTKIKQSNKGLPVLNAMSLAIAKMGYVNFNRVFFVCIQHLLRTTVDLLDTLCSLGANTNNIHVIGKSYSFCPMVANNLIEKGYSYYPNSTQKELGSFAEYFKQDIEKAWQNIYTKLQQQQQNISLIVILDDGGNCLTSVPDYIIKKYNIIGVEQTTSGLTNKLMRELTFPVIEVASAAAKQLLESPMIAETVLKKLSNTLPINNGMLSCAVAGLGVVGKAVADKLVSLGNKVITYDKDINKHPVINGASRMNNLETLFQEADYIFGCTGEDLTENLDINMIKNNKMLISCSSQDTEFLSLLKIIHKNSSSNNATTSTVAANATSTTKSVAVNIFDNIQYSLPNGVMIKIIRGGFPANFDNSGESVIAKDIQLTRGLLLGGMLQGILHAMQHEPSQQGIRYMLHPDIQRFVVANWRQIGSIKLFKPGLLDCFEDSNWIKEHSTGIYQDDKYISNYFQTNSNYSISSNLEKSETT